MSYKTELVLTVNTESKQDADRLAHRIMTDMENYAENYDGVLSALATRGLSYQDKDPNYPQFGQGDNWTVVKE